MRSHFRKQVFDPFGKVLFKAVIHTGPEKVTHLHALRALEQEVIQALVQLCIQIMMGHQITGCIDHPLSHIVDPWKLGVYHVCIPECLSVCEAICRQS